MNTASAGLVLFALDELKVALPVSAVERIVRAVEMVPLPQAPRGVRGVVNLRGKIIPIFDLRARLSRAMRELRLTDHFVIARTARRTVGVIVDAALDVVERPQDAVMSAGQLLPGLPAIEGVLKLDGGMVLIHDLDQFLSPAEETTLAAALEA